MMEQDSIVQRWLAYARQVVSDDDHRARCAELGGSDPDARFEGRGGGRTADFLEDVRWPGYVGRSFTPGGVLWISNIHRNFDSAGMSSEFALDAADTVRRWRDGIANDAVFLEEIRKVYEVGLATWTVGSWPGRVLRALDVPVEAIAYTNVAKCQAVDTGITLQKLCVRQWPLREIVADLEPAVVLLTSATGLRESGPKPWPCAVAAFSQRNGRLLTDSPWMPAGTTGAASFVDWIEPLRSEFAST